MCLGVELLPYHRLGVDKYDQLSIPYPLEGVSPPKASETRVFLQQLQLGLEGVNKRVICNLPAERAAGAGFHRPQ